MQDIAIGAAAIGFVLCGYVGLLCLADVYLIAVHLSVGTKRLKAEAAFLADVISPPKPCPLVCVQLPVHNELASVAAAIDSLCALDWPQDCLEVMVLDDSTDRTSGAVAGRVALWRSRNISIRHVRRAHRAEFKAGALALGLGRTAAEYIAIFDVDYRPEKDFLRKAMAALLAQPDAAFLQVRLDYRNRDRNFLTRAQATELDLSMAYEQAARAWAGIPMTFNGTCGIWRRAAIEAAGGWSGRSLVEDQDLSRRAFALGWSYRYLTTLAVAGELPESLAVLIPQRIRWAVGTGQTFRELPWRLLAHLRWPQAFVFVLLALFHTSLMLTLFLAAVATGLSWLGEVSVAGALTASFASILGLIVLLKSIGAALAARVIGKAVSGRFWMDLVHMWLMEARLVPTLAVAQWRGLRGRRIPFARTYKKGS
jgi:cellulose synthase/poly-beta-1,6-N-acetylglucosamine synthase-like glycosyltransferase